MSHNVHVVQNDIIPNNQDCNVIYNCHFNFIFIENDENEMQSSIIRICQRGNRLAYDLLATYFNLHTFHN